MIDHRHLTVSILLMYVCVQMLSAQIQAPYLKVRDRFLTTPCNDTVLLRGVNKMIIWTNDLKVRKDSYAEIKKTGANCVRIVWLSQPGQFEQDAGPDGLDRTIQDCIDNDMIPMVELHDATGDWSKLQAMVDYWKRPDVVTVLQKHQKYLLVNIANESGDETVTNQQFEDGYRSAIEQLRTAGIHTPLIIDASDWGKNLGQLIATGPSLVNSDPDKNLMFSVHTYWAISEGADRAFITDQLQSAVDANLPLIIGEFTKVFDRGNGCIYEADYLAIIEECTKKKIGYLAWEWGPGNEYADPTCDVMNMTENSYYATLKEGWATDVSTTSQFSIFNTSVTPRYISRGGVCDLTSVNEDANISSHISINPNPVQMGDAISILINKPDYYSMEIIDYIGNSVQTKKGIWLDGTLNKVTIQTLMPGMYFCRLSSAANIISASFVVIQ